MFSRLQLTLALLLICTAVGRSADPPLLHCYISTGDNQWLGQSLPIDSPASIAASFDLLQRLRVKRVYWRGLEAAAWVETVRERPENPRYYKFWRWLRQLYREVEPDRLAVEEAHKRGMEIWGVGNLFDWGAQADVPPFKYYPYGAESGLRIDHPEWVPVDRSGMLRQGGPIELAYPEARKAVVDLHVKLMERDGYDGMTFLTYAENHSMRFQDEFGFSEPIVKEFKRRHGIDIRHQEWKRFAPREDWKKLRGEYVTEFLRELNAGLDAKQRNVGFFLQPWNPREPQPWNVPEVIQTAGSMYFDLETWVREGLVNDFLIYGYADRRMQVRAVKNMRWMTRETPVKVGILTSGPKGEMWKPFQTEGVPTCIAYGEDAMYLDRSYVPKQPMSSLRNDDDPLLVMKALSQIVHGQSKAEFHEVKPLLKHSHLIVRRLALQASGKIGGDEAVAAIEAALFDPENSIRCMAGAALRDAHGPNSVKQILKAIEMHGNHMLAEIMRVTLPRIRPLPRDEMIAAYRDSPSAEVRQMAVRALIFMPHASAIPTWKSALNDPDRFTRVAAVRGLTHLRTDANAIRLLIETVGHKDPVMANEACTALGLVIESNTLAAQQLREEIFEVIRDRYATFGDDYEQVDADWAYRPVGQALLAMGSEGEGALQSFMDQGSDRQLAINAWKTLHIRKQPNVFSEVTEKENAEAMRQRPLFLKKPVVPRLVQNFDDAKNWGPSRRGMVGDVNQVSGRWGALLDEGPFTTRENSDGGQALLVKRGGQSFSGQAVPAVADAADYELSLRVRRQTKSSAVVVQMRGFRGRYDNEYSIGVTEAGLLRLRNMKTDRWEATDIRIPPQQWTSIRVLANRRSQTYNATVKVGDEESKTSKSVPLKLRSNLRLIILYPQPPADSAVLIDDISLMEVR